MSTEASPDPSDTGTFTGPLVDLSGDGPSRGAAHGEELRGLIAETLDRWRERMDERGDGRPEGRVATFLGATGYTRIVAELSPDLHAEIEAIAAASNQPRDDVMAYNFMDEEWRFDRGTGIGCSVVGLVGPRDDVILGQNMDLPKSMYGSQAVLRIAGDGDRPDQIVVTSAGLIGLCGVNSAGVACCVNTLGTLPHSGTGMPVAFLIRELLTRDDAASAARYLTSVPHASGQHYAIADPKGVRGYECSAAGCVAGPVEDTLLHTNHPLWAADGRFPTDLPMNATTFDRLRALEAGVEAIRASGDVETALGSAASGLCIPPTPQKPSATFCSVEFTLTSPPEVRVTLGSPDRAAWQPVPFTPRDVS